MASHLPLSQVNTVTLSRIKEIISPVVRKPAYLMQIFPPELKDTAPDGLLDFIYCTDPSLRNARTSFLNGNVIRYQGKGFSRAHQAELTLIARVMNDPAAVSGWEEFLRAGFPVIDAQALRTLAADDQKLYPAAFSGLLPDAAPHRLLLLLILWSVFGERISMVSGIFAVSPPEPVRQTYTPSPAPASGIREYESHSTLRMFEQILGSGVEITSVDFTFHSGGMWLVDVIRLDQLLTLLKRRCQLRILVDDEAASEPLSLHMRHRDQLISQQTEIVRNWKTFEERHQDLVQIKVSKIPILRNYINFHMREPEQSCMRVVFYTYGNPYLHTNYMLFPKYGSAEYMLFQNEFQYLWDHAETESD